MNNQKKLNKIVDLFRDDIVKEILASGGKSTEFINGLAGAIQRETRKANQRIVQDCADFLAFTNGGD